MCVCVCVCVLSCSWLVKMKERMVNLSFTDLKVNADHNQCGEGLSTLKTMKSLR